MIKIPPPVVSTFRVPRSRSWSSSIPVEQNTNKNETLTRGVSKESSAVCSADNGGWSINNKRNSIEFEGADEEAQSRGLSADNPGIQSIISDSAVRVRRYITFFVARTSILQTVERSNSNNMLDIEMRESSRNQHRYPITVRVNSGELDGGDEDF